jgi:single-strand DNA-binding protein
MAADNHTTIVGNLVDDPELRFTNTGIAVANLRVAVTQRIQQDGEWRDGETSFLRVNVWRGQAEHLADSPGQGRPGDGHRPAAPAQLGDPRGRQAVDHRDRGR